MTPFEQEMLSVVEELLREFGWDATLFKPDPNPVFNRDTLEIDSAPDAQFAVRCMFYDPTTSSLSGYESELPGDESSDRKWIVVYSPEVEVGTGDYVESVTHGKFQFSKVTVVGPGAALYYKTTSEFCNG